MNIVKQTSLLGLVLCILIISIWLLMEVIGVKQPEIIVLVILLISTLGIATITYYYWKRVGNGKGK